MDEKNVNLDALKQVTFEIDKDAFEPKTVTCSRCHIRMNQSEIEVTLQGDLSLKVCGFECLRCKKKYVGLSEARKLDRAMIISRVLQRDFKMERSLSFDGHNWTFRVPKEFTNHVEKKKIEIIPLGNNQFCASVQ